MSDWNTQIIEEFRANEGRVGGPFEGKKMLLLHHRGARTGTVRVNPLAWHPDGDSFAIFASKGGAPTNPDWYHNLLAHPEIEVEVGTEVIPVTARLTSGAERDRLWSEVVADRPTFGEYEQKTDRVIPVLVLDPR